MNQFNPNSPFMLQFCDVPVGGVVVCVVGGRDSHELFLRVFVALTRAREHTHMQIKISLPKKERRV